MGDNEVRSLFLHECEEQIDQVDTLLFHAEAAGCFSLGEIGELFRLVHTLKGSTAMMGYSAISEMTHRAEDILQFLREAISKGSVSFSAEQWNAVIAVCFDLTGYYRDGLENPDGGESVQRKESLERKLTEAAALLQFENPLPTESDSVGNSELFPKSLEKYARFRVFLQPCPLAALRAFLIFRSMESITEHSYTIPNDLQKRPDLDMQIQKEGFELGFIPKEGVSVENVCTLIEKQALLDRLQLIAAPQSAPASITKAATQVAARVSISQERINTLIELMDEAMMLETSLEQRLRDIDVTDIPLHRYLHALTHCSMKIQSGLNELGLAEIRGLFLRMQRLARDLLEKAEKQADVTLTGSELTVDKSVMEAANEILLHTVRNAVDHGLESPEERQQAGKPSRGSIHLSAEKRNNRLRITVSDDGRGISSKNVLTVAKDKGLLVKPTEDYTRQEIYDFLLLSGFSTKKAVSQNSGRGVGLDAVQHMVQKIDGHMEISSTEGKGTAVVFDLPVSLTTADALQVKTDGSTYYLPVNEIRQIISFHGLCPQYGQPVSVDGEPCFPLLPCTGEIRFLVLLTLGESSFCFPCQAIGEYGAFLVKPLPPTLLRILGENNIYSGCIQNALGDIYLLLDVEKLQMRSASRIPQDRSERTSYENGTV